jgi:hypothetical protein
MGGSGTPEAAVELGSTAALRGAAPAGAAPAVDLAAGRLWNLTRLLWPRGREIPEPAWRLPAVAARSG